MRVAFLKPPIGGILGLEMLTFVEPLGLECVAGGLEEGGHLCRIIDLRIEGEPRGLEQCWRFQPQVVGLQCNFTTERYRSLRLARKVKEQVPDAFLIIGGHDASREPEWFADPAIDAVAVGDGEEILPLLVDALERGIDPARVPGLVLHRHGTRKATGPAPARADVDTLPMPARHLIRHYAPHYYINTRKPVALLETARGCPFKCNFCSVWKFHQSKFREKSPERVVAELRQIEAYNVFITDDIFWMDVHRGRELARQIQAAGIKKYFTVQTRTDIICRHPDLVELWKGCGELAVFLGVEAIDDAGLEAVNKRNKAVNNLRAIEILKEMDVGYVPNFIVDPRWEREDFARLREFIRDVNAYNSGFSVLTPLPGTDLWDEMRDQVTTDDWEMYDIVHAVLPTRLSLKDFYAEYSRLWRTALDTRHRHFGRFRIYFHLAHALATGQVTWGAIRKGLNLARVFSRPETFLQAHSKTPAQVVPKLAG